MNEFKNAELIKGIIEKVSKYRLTDLNLMHACGTHQETLVKHGLDRLFSAIGITIKSGPGCPVCITTAREFAEVMALAEEGKIISTYGDCLKVPINGKSLMNLREEGYDIRVVYSVEDAVSIAKTENTDVVFMAIGFETTAPNTAVVLSSSDLPKNFFVYSCHRFFVPAMIKLLEMGENRIQGLIEPGHVSAIIGTKPYEEIRNRFGIPQVISGFEPLDMSISIYMLIRQHLEADPRVENEYSRVVAPKGNTRAIALIQNVFETADIDWRGFPVIPDSLMKIKENFSAHDAKKQFEKNLSRVEFRQDPLEKNCRCGEVLRGLIKPSECPLFGKVCTLDNPVGACMVSVEGTCKIQLEFSGI